MGMVPGESTTSCMARPSGAALFLPLSSPASVPVSVAALLTILSSDATGRFSRGSTLGVAMGGGPRMAQALPLNMGSHTHLPSGLQTPLLEQSKGQRMDSQAPP